MKKLSVNHIHDMPKCLSCYKAILLMTIRAHCFHDYICVMSILLLRDLSTLCVVDTHVYMSDICRYISYYVVGVICLIFKKGGVLKVKPLQKSNIK